MAIQLTDEQEQRLQAAVTAGAYPTAEAALDAALSAVENATVHGFEGTREQLAELLAEGLNSGEAVEANDEFWQRIAARTDARLTGYRTGGNPST